MKKFLSLFPAFVMMACSISAVSPAAYGEDYSDVMDENGYIDGYELPKAPYMEGPVQISPTTVRIQWHMSRTSYCNGFEIAKYSKCRSTKQSSQIKMEQGQQGKRLSDKIQHKK